jgi:hypothetical protein
MNEKNTTLGEETAKKITEKSVMIRKYKGHIIKYRAGLFLADKNKEQTLSHNNESSLIMLIDKRVKEKEEQKVLLKKQKELEGINNKLSKAKALFDGEELKKGLEAVMNFCVEAPLVFLKKELVILCMDPANVACIRRSIPFKEGKNIEGMKMMMNLSLVQNFLKVAAKKDETIKMSFIMSTSKRMILENGFGKATFPLTDLEEEPKAPEKLVFPNSITLGLSEYHKIINLAYTMAESIKFEMKDDVFTVSAQGDLSDYSMNIRKVKDQPDNKSKYSIEYLRKKFFHEPIIHIQFSKDYPVKISDDKGNWMLLAPRIDSRGLQ